MATFTAINCKHQTSGAMRGTLDYVAQEKKTRWGDAKLVTGHNCVPQSAYTEMLTTKHQFRKTDLGVLLLVVRGLQKQRRDLLEALFLCLGSEIGVLVPRLRLTGESGLQIFLSLRSGIFGHGKFLPNLFLLYRNAP